MAIATHRVPTVVNLIPKEKQTYETLFIMFEERVADINDHIKNRLSEYFMYIQNAREEVGDWFFWAHKGIMDVATKTTTDQRNIAYLIGIYKSWLNYGFGTFYSAELHKAKELFSKRFGVEPSQAAQAKISSIIQEHGIVRAVEGILMCEEQEEDRSLAAANACAAHLETLYGK